MNKRYTFEHDFLMEKFLKEEPQTLDDMIPDCFNDWLERKDFNDIIEYAEEYGDKIKTKTRQEIVDEIEIQINEIVAGKKLLESKNLLSIHSDILIKGQLQSLNDLILTIK